MNVTSNERHLGRRLTLTTVDGQVAQIDHQERIADGMMKSVRGKPAPRDEIRLRFDDGGEVSLSVLGRGFKATPGQRVTAVRAAGSGDAPLLYCYNHGTRRGWFNGPGFASVRRRAPYRTVLLLLPLLALLGLWMSPAQTRADLAGWVEQMTGETSAEQTSNAQLSGDRPRLFGQSRTQHNIAPPRDSWLNQPLTIESVRTRLTQFVLSGWRDRNWYAFGIVAALGVPLCFMLGHVMLVWPATRSLRKKSKRLVQQHCQAMKA